MSNQERTLLTRSEKKQRDQRSQKRKKMDRLLNVLIAIVSILIVLNLIAVFNDDNNKENEKEQATLNEKVNNTKAEQEEVATQNNDENEQTNEQTKDSVDSNKQQGNSGQKTGELSSNEEQSAPSQLIVQSSNDPIVKEVIIDPNWQPTSTKQTGEHVSAYEEGNVDYEEKLETFRNAVNLDPNNIIYWSVKNNGSADTSVAVVSSNDRTEKYRIYIEWIQNEGWKPSKVEKLSEIVGAN